MTWSRQVTQRHEFWWRIVTGNNIYTDIVLTHSSRSVAYLDRVTVVKNLLSGYKLKCQKIVLIHVLVGLKVYSEIYENVQILKIFFGHRVQHQKQCLHTKFESMSSFWGRKIRHFEVWDWDIYHFKSFFFENGWNHRNQRSTEQSFMKDHEKRIANSSILRLLKFSVLENWKPSIVE